MQPCVLAVGTQSLKECCREVSNYTAVTCLNKLMETMAPSDESPVWLGFSSINALVSIAIFGLRICQISIY